MTNPAAAVPPEPLQATAVARELGRPGNIQTVFTTRGEQKYTPMYADPNVALRFPESVKVFDRMMRTDDQVGAIMSSLTLPVLDARWTLTDKGIRPEVVALVRHCIGLPADGEGPATQDPANRVGVVFPEHLEEALEGVLGYGFMPFELEWAVTSPGDPGHPPGAAWATRPAKILAGLHSRPPETIFRILVDRRGQLAAIVQHPIPGDTRTVFTSEGDVGLEIPAENLLYYILRRRGADWSGISVLRNSYRPWRIKDDYTRWDAIAAERNSLGIPMITYDPQVMTREAALEFAQSVRAGAEAGIALPVGIRLESFGMAANTLDLGPRIDRANQAMSRSTLAMVLDMGHDDGARSLGETYLKMLLRSLGWSARKIGTQFTQAAIRALVAANYGPDEPYPQLVCEAITAESLSPDALASLITSKVIFPDDVLDADQRRRYGLPEADPDTARGAEEPETAEPDRDGTGDGQNPFLPADDQDPDAEQGEPAPSPFTPEGQRRAASLSGYISHLERLVAGS